MDEHLRTPDTAPIHLDPSTTVFRQGDRGTCAYLVESGSFQVLHRTNDGTVHSSRASAGDVLGELALVDGGARNSTAVAETVAVLVPITRATIRGKLEAAEPVTRAVMSALIRRLREVLDPARRGPPALQATRLRAPAADELRLASVIEGALAGDHLEARFQPIVCCDGLRPVGFEALLRFRDGHHPGQPVARIIQVAEQTGLIERIGVRMLAAAQDFRDRLASMEGMGHDLFVAVNVSAEQLDRPRASRDLLRLLQDRGGQHIHLEITETALARNPARLRRLLGHFQRTGAHLSLDDFGTGYSSIGYLNRFPLDVLKIDRSFVSALERRPMAANLVRAIAGLARELGISTVAEGVESGAQLGIVRQAGCHYAQGFYLSPALAASRALGWLGGSSGDGA